MDVKKLQSVPEVGHKYHFFDDGKMADSRHYIATCISVIPIEMANEISVKEKSLYTYWKDFCKEDNLYADETDYFVQCHIDEYCEDNMWFVRTIDGGWFSIYGDWYDGILDVDNIIYNVGSSYFNYSRYI